MVSILLFLTVCTFAVTIANEIEITPRLLGIFDVPLLWQVDDNLQEVDPCQDTPEYTRRGSIFVEFVGRPGRITSSEIQLLENAFISTYESIASEICEAGFRRLDESSIDTNAIPDYDSVQRFRLQFNTFGLCQGCSNDKRFIYESRSGKSKKRMLTAFDSQRRLKKSVKGKKGNQNPPEKERQKLKGSKKGGELSVPMRCICPPPPRLLLTQAFDIAVGSLKENGTLESIRSVNDIEEMDPLTSTSFPVPTPSLPSIAPSPRPTPGPTPNPTQMEDLPNLDLVPASSPPPIAPSPRSTPGPTPNTPGPTPNPTQMEDLSNPDLLQLPYPDIFETCPFNIHFDAFGESDDGVFPLYDISTKWDNTIGTFTGVDGDDPLLFQNVGFFADWEEFQDAEPAVREELMGCIQDIGFSATGTVGAISGDVGTPRFFATIVSYMEDGQEQHVVVPTGCFRDFFTISIQRRMTGHSLLDIETADFSSKMEALTFWGTHFEADSSARSLHLVGECPLIEAAVEANACPNGMTEIIVESCVADVESIYRGNVDDLIVNRQDSLLKNLDSEGDEVSMLLVRRSALVAFSYARCQCSNSAGLEDCLREAFFEIVADELNTRSEADEVFDDLNRLVVERFNNDVGSVCNLAQAAASNCITCGVCSTDIPNTECCEDMDCSNGNLGDVCTGNTCIDEGNPRFTLTWDCAGK
jgi:hypothetical protein